MDENNHFQLNIREAESADLPFLFELEKSSFEAYQQADRRNIIHSLKSENQKVYICELADKHTIDSGEKNGFDKKTSPKKNKKTNTVSIGSMVLFVHKKSIRIYSIAVDVKHRNYGAGAALVNKAMQLAEENFAEKITLEAHSTNEKLIDWYLKFGFQPVKIIRDYYSPGEDAMRMEIVLNTDYHKGKTRNIIVINRPHKWKFDDVNARIISVRDYISNPIYQSNTELRIFNLCSSYAYQSYGYYVSLLAVARGQRVIPTVTKIRDLKILNVIKSVTTDIEGIIADSFEKIEVDKLSINVFFGFTDNPKFKKLVMKLYQLFEIPLFKVDFVKDENWFVKKIHTINLDKLTAGEFNVVNRYAHDYFNKKRFTKSRLINYKYDLAILINPDEKTPPSCKQALQKFKEAANRKNMHAEFIHKNDFDRINEFDALFIRVTTNVNNHSYEFSRLAHSEGLVVIDDPWSIMKCSNKIYQNEVFRQNKILTPKTYVLTRNLFSPVELEKLKFPMVLKQPDSAFSLGVIKVENKAEAIVEINRLFRKSDMVICQEYTYSDFDWRVGILDNQPLFASKYFMSKGHWQIYNWGKDDTEKEGDYETVPVEDVPEVIIKTAVKAAALIGDGLYGVDLKLVNGKAFVIEVNDNPNIDAGVEDAILKNKLYDRIIESFINRIEISRNINQIIGG